MFKTAYLAAAMAAIAESQTDVENNENPSLEIASCQALSCSPPDGSICATGDTPGPEVGIGMVSQAINSTSTSLSFTLIDGLDENGFTGIGSSEYEYSDQQLFVGVSSSASAEDFPSGCALMMQYQGQTLPLEPLLADDTRSPSSEGTTSCDGVVNPLARAYIDHIIRDFNGSGAEPRCDRLVEHVNAELRGSPGAAGGEGGWIANFFNVTGGPLPRPNSTSATAERLGSEECRPVLPESYDMYKIAEMRQLFFADPPDEASGFLGRLYGGRTGWTPVVTVIYGDEEDDPSLGVSFLCMETFAREGGKRDSPLDDVGARNVASVLLAAVPVVASLVNLI